MFNTIKTLALATCLVTASAFSADAGNNANGMETLRAKLRDVEQKAMQVSNLTKQKSASADAVRVEAEALSASVKEFRAYVTENAHHLQFNDPKQKFVLETTTQTMDIIVDNKLRVIDERDYKKSRGLIRDKAKGILLRVKIVEKNIG